ncbi:hypothetical protein DPMN_072093 [Dreissena polymorpha]|uniref:Uncharacterized protein n=1 Tax=Dreissena polymorpha TaxID=45954 RepID=A0A9D3Z410_DREPO|nr:hypothetical protein DPMN_072093 [Dreissena polymorpha]
MAAGKALIVAAIDFGTTYSGWAFSFKHEFESDPTKVSTKIWRESSLLSNKGPTCILINPDGQTLGKFGYEAETYYSELCTKGLQKDYYYFHRFKMMLWDKVMTTDAQVEDASGKLLPALLVFSLSIRLASMVIT